MSRSLTSTVTAISICPSPNRGDDNTVWLNNGSGAFSDSGQSLGSGPTRAVSFADLDGDGDPDLVFSDDGADDTVWFNDGAGRSSTAGRRWASGRRTVRCSVDLDGDGDVDIAYAGDNEGDTVWFNDGSGSFTDSGQNPGTRSQPLGQRRRPRRRRRPGPRVRRPRGGEHRLAQRRHRDLHRLDPDARQRRHRRDGLRGSRRGRRPRRGRPPTTATPTGSGSTAEIGRASSAAQPWSLTDRFAALTPCEMVRHMWSVPIMSVTPVRRSTRRAGYITRTR